MIASERPDRMHVAFDDPCLVANAVLMLPVTLACHLRLGELMHHHVNLGDASGRANAGDKMLTLAATCMLYLTCKCAICGLGERGAS